MVCNSKVLIQNSFFQLQIITPKEGLWESLLQPDLRSPGGPFTPPRTLLGKSGALTLANITYFTDFKCTSRNVFFRFQCEEYAPKLGYDIDFTYDGDGTVVVPSALAMKEEDGGQRLWFDLFAYNKLNVDRIHKDIFEVPEVIDFIKNTIQSTSTQATPRYLSNIRINPDIGNRLSFILHY